MEKNGRKEFCSVCKTTTVLRRRSLAPASSLLLWVYLILGLILIGQLKTVDVLVSWEPSVRVIYIVSIIVFAAYDSFIRTLDYRCQLCGEGFEEQRFPSNRFVQLLIIASTVFFALLLMAIAAFLIYIFITV